MVAGVSPQEQLKYQFVSCRISGPNMATVSNTELVYVK